MRVVNIYSKVLFVNIYFRVLRTYQFVFFLNVKLAVKWSLCIRVVFSHYAQHADRIYSRFVKLSD